jgi:hypothetical protein
MIRKRIQRAAIRKEVLAHVKEKHPELRIRNHQEEIEALIELVYIRRNPDYREALLTRKHEEVRKYITKHYILDNDGSYGLRVAEFLTDNPGYHLFGVALSGNGGTINVIRGGDMGQIPRT